MTEEKLVGSIDVGDRKTVSEKHTICFEFHDFANLPRKRGDRTSSPSLLCHGRAWSIDVYPGGDNASNLDETHFSVYLRMNRNAGDSSEVWVKFAVRAGPAKKKCTHAFSPKKSCFGFADFVKRSEVLNFSNKYISDGSLKIKVDIQVYTSEQESWMPKETLPRDMLRLLDSEMDSDVAFLVGENKFKCHRLILKMRAPQLATLAEECPDGSDVPIEGVEPAIFRTFLRFVYGGELPPPEEMKRDAFVLLEVADKCGCSQLKLVAESEILSAGIDVDNAAELLLFADAHSCALLRESAVDFIAANAGEVMASIGWSKVEASAQILSELVKVAFNRKAMGARSERGTDFGLSVVDLRKKLEEKGLDVDGTREMLIERLETASK